MKNLRTPLFGIAVTLGAILTLGACSSDSSETTIVSDSVVADSVTSDAMTSDAMSSEAMTSEAMTS